MEFITSRGFTLPDHGGEMADELWFNMWQRKLWPYQELVPSDLLYWYESPSKRIVWRTRVAAVDRFSYASKREAARGLKERFGDFDEGQPYYVRAPEQGFCLAWKVDPLQRLNLAKPRGFRFPQQGWLRIDDETAKAWLQQEATADDATLDEIIPSGTLFERLQQLNEAMAEVSPDRVQTIVSRTIRHDTQLVEALKEACEFRCQFPNCDVRIPKREGGFYIEVAHIQPLSKCGRSIVGNLLVLCPNHHKELDYGDLEIIEQTVEHVHGRLNGREFAIDSPTGEH